MRLCLLSLLEDTQRETVCCVCVSFLNYNYEQAKTKASLILVLRPQPDTASLYAARSPIQ